MLIILHTHGGICSNPAFKVFGYLIYQNKTPGTSPRERLRAVLWRPIKKFKKEKRKKGDFADKVVLKNYNVCTFP
jgi:hypothetical protein